MLPPPHTQVALVGHSQGGTLPLMLLSRRPEYNKKVSVYLGLAPVVYLNLITSAPMAASCKAANVGDNRLFSKHCKQGRNGSEHSKHLLGRTVMGI